MIPSFSNNDTPFNKQNPTQNLQEQPKQGGKNFHYRHSVQLQNTTTIANAVRRSSVQQSFPRITPIKEEQNHDSSEGEVSISPSLPSNRVTDRFAQQIPQFPSTFLKLNPAMISSGGFTPSNSRKNIDSLRKVENYVSPFDQLNPMNYNSRSQSIEKEESDDEDYNMKAEGVGRRPRRSRIFFDFHRANVFNKFNYQDEDEEKPNFRRGEGNNEFRPTRVTLIQSTFVSNPYHYDLDHVSVDDLEDSFGEYSKAKRGHGRVHTYFGPRDSFFQLFEKLQKTNDIYYDKEFSPCLESLIGRNEARISQWGNCIWLRPDEFYGKGNFDIFQGIEPNDIEQGQLGDCYFLSTLSSLAEWPHRIQKIFRSKKVNSSGIYCVNICDMGEWKEVIIDDYFPCYEDTRKPLFTKGNDNELWVLILEKVWAKVYGSYDSIEVGLARECLHDFTGAPTKFFLTDKKEEWDMIWDKLAKAEAKQYAMTCGARDFFSNNKIKKISSKGIVGAHAYSLLAAYEIFHHGQKVRLVKLRNPWGKTEWNGAWSDSSSNWTPELKYRLNMEKKNDGIFYMAYEDFLKYFTDIQFCYIHDDYQYNSLRVSSTQNHAVYFKLKVETQGKYYVTVNQESKRRHQDNPLFKYSTVSIVLSKIAGYNKYRYVSGNNRADREVWAKGELTPGEYLVYTKVQWNIDALNTDFVLSTYGPSKAHIEVVSKTEYPEFLEKTFTTRGRNSTKKMSYAREGESQCFSVVDITRDGFLYCYYQNRSYKTLQTEVYFKEFKGVKLRKPFRGKGFTLQIPPNDDKIVLLRILPNQDVKQVLVEKVKFLIDESSASNRRRSQINDEKSLNYPIPVKNNKLPYLDSEARANGEVKKIKDEFTGETTQIYIYQYKHDDGIYLMFENHTKDEILEECIFYELYGLEPIGFEEREIKFALHPGESHRIGFKRKAGLFDAKFKFESTIRKTSKA